MEANGRAPGLLNARRNIRVCILTSVHPIGDPRVFHKEAVGLARAGYTVALGAAARESKVVQDVEILAVAPPRSRWLRMTVTVAQVTWRALRWRAQIYHLQDPELITAGLILKLIGKKVVLDVHEEFRVNVVAKSYLPALARAPVGWLVAKAELLAAHMFDAIVPATEHIALQFAGHPRVITIQNYPPITGDVVEAEHASNPEYFTVVYAGRLSHERGVTSAVEAIGRTRTPNARLVLYGDASDEYVDRLKHLPGWTRTEFKGYIPFEQALAEIGRAQVGVCVLLPFGQYINTVATKVFDYMSRQVPVITSNFPLVSALIAETKAGIAVDPQDPNAIAAAIDYLAEHEAERQQMGENGYRAAVERFSWQAQEAKLVRLYDRLALTAPGGYCEQR